MRQGAPGTVRNQKGHIVAPVSTITTVLDNNNVTKLLNNDKQWHDINIHRLSALIRKNRIPQLQHFTTQYDYNKVHEHDFPQQIEQLIT